MPPFPKDAPFKVRTPQARLLVILAGEDCPPLTKPKLAEAAGFSVGSGTINSSINGVPEGSSSGKPTLGLLEMGLVQRFELDIDGQSELVYIISEAGREALRVWMEENGGLPQMRDKAISTNRRYGDGKIQQEERPTAGD